VRCLIIGCGCRGRLLAGALVKRGHVVRGTSRDPARLEPIRAAGAEPAVADPDRVATLMPCLEQVSLAYILLGSAAGAAEQLRALHGPRLEMLLTKLIDTPVRGVVYEAEGSVERELLSEGARRVREFGARSSTPTAILTAAPEPPAEWVAAALEAMEAAVGAE
jgi:uncharacterized protein YbjT (DUF2867 family)